MKKVSIVIILLLLFLPNTVFGQEIILRETGLDLSKATEVTPALPKVVPFSESSLPQHWDWREHGGVTPVKDQGDTGTCWAFATTGPLEHAIKIKDKVDVDLSEQFLVSYNKEGYGVEGGWFAHDYHRTPGAVLEFDFPYMARDDIPWTRTDYEHVYKLTDWGYVGEVYGIPNEEAIKTAIYKYGSVAVAVHADINFIRHKKGVFKGSWWSGRVNHAVMLVGWNDQLQSWILKNSWGTGWGDNGYMYIKYGANSIGFAANYINY